MSDLKEKAKTSYEISEDCYIICAKCKSELGDCGTENCDATKTRWARLEDAQKEMRQLEKRISYLDTERKRAERLYSQALQKIVDLKNERLELKQKLQQLRDFWVAHIEPVDHQQKNPYYFTLRVFTKEEMLKVVELLKEERKAK
jgi:chromosome segregation ATPase